jgi:transposase-like protein
MRAPIFSPSIARLRVTPDDPAAVVAQRPRGSRRPHTDVKVAAVRHLIEQTTLTYSEIAAKTGVARASICRWTRDGAWQRPLFAPRATDTVPSPRASAKLRRRTLAARLSALAERAIRELEDSASVELDKLAQALELLKMAKLADRPRRGRRRIGAQGLGAQNPGRSLDMMDEPARTNLIADLRAAGVKIANVPESALGDFIASHAPPRDEPALRPRGHRSKRNRDHARMLEPYRG